MRGRFCDLEPLDAQRHARELFSAIGKADESSWTYLPYGPFDDLASFTAWIEDNSTSQDPCFFAINDAKTRTATGVAAYLRIQPASGSIEVGHLHFSPALRRTPAATEAMYLMMRNAFELGYRRYEWKCDALNRPSRLAAERLGFTFEGIFRQATVYKGRSRDTAWYSVIDSEWPALQRGFSSWLDPGNFDADGAQRQRLSELVRSAHGASVSEPPRG